MSGLLKAVNGEVDNRVKRRMTKFMGKGQNQTQGFKVINGAMINSLLDGGACKGDIKSLQLQQFLDDDEELSTLVNTFHKKSE